MSGSVTDTDKGYDALLRLMQEVDGAGVTVGVQQEEGQQRPPDSSATLAEYAAYNEFGTSRAPERSFLRSTADNQRGAWGAALQEEIGDAVDALPRVGSGDVTADLRRGLDRVGLRAVRDVQQTIRDLRTPPNAPSTVKAKKSSNPLIRDGRLRASIRHKVEGL